jgi:hypothetical protein
LHDPPVTGRCAVVAFEALVVVAVEPIRVGGHNQVGEQSLEFVPLSRIERAPGGTEGDPGDRRNVEHLRDHDGEFAPARLEVRHLHHVDQPLVKRIDTHGGRAGGAGLRPGEQHGERDRKGARHTRPHSMNAIDSHGT